MNLITETHGNTKIVTIHGDVDLYNASELRDIIHKQEDPGVNALIISFRDVSYIDSSGIGSLLHIIRAAWAMKIKVAFTEITPPVMELIELTKLRTFFPIAGSIDEAYRMIESARGA